MRFSKSQGPGALMMGCVGYYYPLSPMRLSKRPFGWVSGEQGRRALSEAKVMLTGCGRIARLHRDGAKVTFRGTEQKCFGTPLMTHAALTLRSSLH